MSEKRITKVTLSRSKRSQGKTDWARVRALSEEDALKAASADPDNPPLTREELARLKRSPDVRAIRAGLGLTQDEFARVFQLSLATVRDWEQGRYQPDQGPDSAEVDCPGTRVRGANVALEGCEVHLHKALTIYGGAIMYTYESNNRDDPQRSEEEGSSPCPRDRHLAGRVRAALADSSPEDS